jgi:formylmethanofuran dehydrogenase subunit E
VENDSCAVDAVQVLTGCTFGKGNLIFHDYGKMIFTFVRRRDGRSVRLAFSDLSGPHRRHRPPSESRAERIAWMLSEPPERLFQVRQSTFEPVPEKARIHESVECDICGESVMITRMRRRGAGTLCIPCEERQHASPARQGRHA